MSAPKTLTPRREHTPDRAAAAVQQSTADMAKVLGFCPLLRGKLVTGIVFAAGVERVVRHGMGVRATGYIEVRRYGANVANGIGESGTVATDPKNEIWLITTLDTTRDIWFFA